MADVLLINNDFIDRIMGRSMNSYYSTTVALITMTNHLILIKSA